MQIFINGQLAALKKGTSFEYVSENRLFSGSEGYSMTITFPLRGCPKNVAIFGNINRCDVVAQKLIYNCEIRDRRFSMFGSVTITEISESEVKAQFLEGRSEQNFDKTFDKVYINELDLGEPDVSINPSPTEAWDPSFMGFEYVALPWVNDSEGVINNRPTYVPPVLNANGIVKEPSSWHWYENGALSYQPYLLFIAKQICRAPGVEYEFDFTQWEEHPEYKYLLVCNTLPAVWERCGFAAALPHWTVDEFFEKLELFLNGEFVINHKAKKISFAFTENLLASRPPVQLTKVIDEHSENITVDSPKCDYLYTKNIVYADSDHELWKYQSCDWYIRQNGDTPYRFKTLRELIASCQQLKTYINDIWKMPYNPSISHLLYAEDVDAYFLARPFRKSEVQPSGLRPMTYQYDCMLQPINMFGGRIVDESDDADSEEIEFVPVRIDRIDEGFGRLCMFLTFNGDNDSEDPDPLFDGLLFAPRALEDLRIGEKEKTVEFYDKIFVGFWDGALQEEDKSPYPYTEDVVISDDWETVIYPHFSLRLNNKHLNTRRYASVHNIDVQRSVTFKFLSDSIPDVRSVFIINGKQYLCEKITATFTENGMSQLLKGIFWPIGFS